MPDMMAIVSKAVFEREAGKSPAVGTRLGMDRYVSTNKNLGALAGGGRLYLVTVRPPSEDLWLVAILDQPKHDGEAWVAARCGTPITDITSLRAKIKFESGSGITAKKGALGMSLQTPRALTADDAALLDQAASQAAGPSAAAAGQAAGAASQAAGPSAAAAGQAAGAASQAAGLSAAAAGQAAGAASQAARAAGQAASASAAAAGQAASQAAGANAPAEAAHGAALLAAILEDPENDDARRIYADLLVERGDPRGDFILVDLALDGRLSIRKRAQLSARRWELLEAHRKRWFPYALGAMRTRHGFLHAVKGNFKQLRAAASKLFAAEPVTEVELGGVDEELVKPLLAAPWLPRVRRLILRGATGDQGFARLAASPAAAGLRALNVGNHRLGPEALARLGAGLPRCTSLVLSGNPIGNKGLAGLRRWQHLPGVETLYLSGCGISAPGIHELLRGAAASAEAAGALARLDKLCLSDNDGLGNKAMEALAAYAPLLPRLRRLELINTGLGEAGARAILDAPFPALRRLDVRKNRLGKLAADPRVRR